MAIDFVLDGQDFKTRALVNKLAIVSDELKTEQLTTQVSRVVTRVGLVSIRDEERTPINGIPTLALKLSTQVTGFESEPGRLATVINDDGKSIADQRGEGTTTPRGVDDALFYVLNADEVKSAIDGGLYDNGRDYMKRLNQEMVNLEYTRPESVLLQRQRVSVRPAQQTRGLVAAVPDEQVTINTLMPSEASGEFFDSHTPNNTFTFLLADTLQDLKASRTKNPEVQARPSYHDEYAASKQTQDVALDHDVSKSEVKDELNLSGILDQLHEKIVSDTATAAPKPEPAAASVSEELSLNHVRPQADLAKGETVRAQRISEHGTADPAQLTQRHNQSLDDAAKKRIAEVQARLAADDKKDQKPTVPETPDDSDDELEL